MADTSTDTSHDVLVVGGGPAGCAAAASLARHGHDVALITRPAPPAKWLAESIPSSARKLLERVGALDALDAAGLVPNEGNTVWWADMPRREERFETHERGFHADRAALEAVFHGVALEAGARLRTDGPVIEAAAEPDGWRIATAAGNYRARWVLDASGRAGVLARRGFRIRERGIATLALIGRWTAAPDRPAPDPGCTLIESYRDGWAWSVPTSPGTRCVTAMVDPRRTRLSRELGLEGMWRTELGKAARLARRLGRGRAGGRLAGPVRACPASLYGATSYGRAGLLLVGDAGSFIDPLSSYGVKKALASGWLAAIVAHTALEDEAMTGPACDFYDDREREVYRTYRALSVPFLEQAAEANGHAFWEVRLAAAREAGAGILEPASPSGAPAVSEPGDRSLAERQADAFLARPEVRAAWETIRSLPAVRFRAGATLATVRRPAVVGDRVALERLLTSERLPGGARFLRNVDLRRLTNVAPTLDQVPDIYQAYNRLGSPVPLPDFLAVLAFAVGAGLLELQTDTSCR
ncbi:NAD(P)/FAD-dependent oxidoreductase [Candidatus Palauibacter sp.]|uniref:NAD(P)/FAD-dependent oxidoreductase n=1 Tax=Candidatus Palauibacter sp. TaxID=3101350 RepID=UPI003B5C6A48